MSNTKVDNAIKTLIKEDYSGEDLVKAIVELDSSPKKVVKKFLEMSKLDEEDIVSIIESLDKDVIDQEKLLLERIKKACESFENYYVKTKNKSWFEAKGAFPLLSEIWDILEEWYDADDVMDIVGEDELFESLKSTSVFCDYVDECEEEKYDEGYKDGKEDAENEWRPVYKNSQIEDRNPDQLWQFFAEELGVGSYYDVDTMKKKINEMIEKLNKSSYCKETKKSI